MKEEFYSDKVDYELLDESVLAFDIAGRGYTSGAYVGEAATLEILEWIRKEFLIDEDRTYIIGQSNGGFATYSIAQNYPDLSAAIYPLISYPNIDTLDNISNIPTYQIVSSKDHVFHSRESEVYNILYKYKNYYEIKIEEMIHSYLKFYVVHINILNKILKHKRNKYPKNIVFKTQRNRHLNSYYIELFGIAKNADTAYIRCDILDERNVKITTSGTNGFKFVIPPIINKEKFAVFINNIKFSFVKFAKVSVNFLCMDKWEIVDFIPEINYRKGSGLLDVYLDSLQIIIPNNSDKRIENLANKFSKPYSNGFDPIVFVDYPILYEELFDINSMYGKNFIIIDYKNTNKITSKINLDLIVKYDENGYYYNNERIDKDYVIMQVVANPYNKLKSILVISTNNLELLNKHRLLRRLTLPTYCYGLHPYWNKEVYIE